MPLASQHQRAIQRFEVSLKAFIVHEGHALFVRESDTGWWELPGGRIDVGEEWEPQSAILAREIAEELGRNLELSVGREAVTWMRRRPTDGQPSSACLGSNRGPRLSRGRDWIEES